MGGRQARINGLLEQLKENNRAALVNAANIYTAAMMAVRMLARRQRRMSELWRIDPATGPGEVIEFKRSYHSVLPIIEGHSTELVSFEIFRKNWRGTWVENAQCDVVKLAEGYFVINPSGRHCVADIRAKKPPMIGRLKDPRLFCFLPRKPVKG